MYGKNISNLTMTSILNSARNRGLCSRIVSLIRTVLKRTKISGSVHKKESMQNAYLIELTTFDARGMLLIEQKISERTLDMGFDLIDLFL